MNKLSAVDVFREIAEPNSTTNEYVKASLRVIINDGELFQALLKFTAERGEALCNFALAAITLGAGHIDPGNIEESAKRTKLDDFEGVFKNLALGHAPAEIASPPLSYPTEEVDPMVNALTAAGIFDAGQNDLHPDVIDLLGDLVRHQPPPALADRRRRQLFGE